MENVIKDINLGSYDHNRLRITFYFGKKEKKKRNTEHPFSRHPLWNQTSTFIFEVFLIRLEQRKREGEREAVREHGAARER